MTLPPIMMALPVLGDILADAELTPGDDGDEFYYWLRGFGICCGRTRTAPTEWCLQFAVRAVMLLRENRALVLKEVQERMESYGFEPVTTIASWLTGLQKIAELTPGMHEQECTWFAPLHRRDSFQTGEDVRRFRDWLGSQPEQGEVPRA